MKPVSVGDQCWVSPRVGSFLINVDAAIDKERGMYGIGILVKNSDGVTVDARWKCWPFLISVEAAELLAIKEGLLVVREGNLLSFSITSDCASVVSLLHKKGRILNDLGVIVDEIHNWYVCRGFEDIVYVLRRLNCPAHRLAR